MGVSLAVMRHRRGGREGAWMGGTQMWDRVLGQSGEHGGGNEVMVHYKGV